VPERRIDAFACSHAASGLLQFPEGKTIRIYGAKRIKDINTKISGKSSL
jgi:hypothetical protein